MSLGSRNGVVSIWILNGFQLQYFFSVSKAEINSISLQSSNLVVLSSENKVKFWDISKKNDPTDVKFPLLQEFELDGECLSVNAYGKQAVVGCSTGSIYYLSPEGSNQLVTSTSQMTDLGNTDLKCFKVLLN